MNQIERISHMEQLLTQAEAAVRALSDALEQYTALLPAIRELTAYYEGPVWRADFEDDCAGKIPMELKRGVLSEDAVYNLLTEIDELNKRYALASK